MTDNNKATLQIVYEQLNGAVFDITDGNPDDALTAIDDCITRLSVMGVNAPDEALRTKPLRPRSDEVTRLRGEIGVLVGLLGAALQVIETVEGENAPECEALMELQNKITYAIRGAST